jgi:hypothetical protein
MNPSYIIPIIAVCLTFFGLLGGILVKAFMLGRDLGEIKSTIARAAHLASYVPAMWWDVECVKRHLAISTPQVPDFHNHDAEE